MLNVKFSVSACIAIATLSGSVLAQESEPSRWSVHVGPAWIKFNTRANVSLGGTTVHGAGVDASRSTTLAFDVGYNLTPNLMGRLTLGIPPTTKLTGSNALAPAGELGQLKYGPAVFSLTWSFDGFGPVRPYLGAGVNYTIVLESKDGAISGLDAKNAFGGVIQAGLDLPIYKQWGLFVDVKKIYLKTSATGMVGPAPAIANVRLNPLLVQAGLSYRF